MSSGDETMKSLKHQNTVRKRWTQADSSALLYHVPSAEYFIADDLCSLYCLNLMAVKWKQRAWRFIGCCVTNGVAASCHKLCTYNALDIASDADLITCNLQLRRIAACATSMYVFRALLICSLDLFNGWVTAARLFSTFFLQYYWVM